MRTAFGWELVGISRTGCVSHPLIPLENANIVSVYNSDEGRRSLSTDRRRVKKIDSNSKNVREEIAFH